MTTQAHPRDTRNIKQRVAEYQRDLEELRAAMKAREALRPDTPEYRAALAHEDELLEKIHRWAFGQAHAGPGSTR